MANGEVKHTETKHLERTAWLDLSNEGQHYRMAEFNLLAASVIYRNITDLGEAVRQRKFAGLTVEPELLAHVSPLVSPHPAHRRIPVAKTPITALAYDSARYRRRPGIRLVETAKTARRKTQRRRSSNPPHDAIYVTNLGRSGLSINHIRKAAGPRSAG